MTSSIPSSLGNPGPRHRAVLTIPAGPKRLTDDRELARFHVPPGGPRAPRFARPPRLADARDILVVRLDFVGDWIVTTPLLDEIRALAPRARITAVVIDRAFALADADPGLDRVVSITWARGRRVCFGASDPATLAGFVADYRGRRFDLALVPRWDIDFNGAAQIAFGAGAPRTVGFAERSTPVKAIANRGDDRFYTDLVDDRRVLHEAARQMTLLSALGRRDWRERPVRAAFTAADAARADAERTRAFSASAGERPVVAVAPFVDQGRRTLPAEILAPIVRRVQAAFGVDIAVIAAPIHADRADDFVRALGPRAASFAGRLTLRETAAFASGCAALIGMDSGPAHIAAGVDTPVVVFSCHPADAPDGHPQSPARFAPRAPEDRSLVLRPDHAIAPCRDGCERAGAHCITQLDEATVWPRLSAFLRATLAGEAALDAAAE